MNYVKQRSNISAADEIVADWVKSAVVSLAGYQIITMKVRRNDYVSV